MADQVVKQTPTAEVSEAELVSRIGKAMNPQADDAETVPEQPKAAQTQQAEEAQEESQDSQDQDGEPAEEEAKDSADAVDLDAPFIPTKYKADDGQDVEETLSINQLRSGYMMNKDYFRKTTELARTKDNLQKSIDNDRQQYVQGLQTAEQALMALVVPELQAVNFEQLAKENPSEALLLRAKAEKLQGTIQHLRAQREQAEQEAVKKMAEESKIALSDPITGIPGWSDKLYNELITKAGPENGFDPESVAKVVDHKMIRVLWKASQWDKAQSAKPKDQVKPASKVLKPGAPQAARDQQAKQQEHLKLRLQKSGSLEDAAALYRLRKGNG